MTLSEFLTGIANAIRATKGTTEPIPAANFADEIASIDSSGETVEPVLTELEVSANGEYVPGDGIDGYSRVTVNVDDGSADSTDLKMVEFIISDGASCIDTGVLAQSGLTITVDAQYLSTASNQALFGAKESASSNRLSLFYYQDSELYFYYGSSGYPYVKTVSITDRHIFRAVGNILYVDEVQTITGTAASFTGSQNIAIFACNYASGVKEHSIARLYSMQIENGGELIRDFVPAIYNGVIGLYDRVDGKMYENCGTGALAAGPATEE